MTPEEIIAEINKVVDKVCLKRCGHLMKKECKEKHCLFYIISDNAYFHFEMGLEFPNWNNMLVKDLENLKEKEVILNEPEEA